MSDRPNGCEMSESRASGEAYFHWPQSLGWTNGSCTGYPEPWHTKTVTLTVTPDTAKLSES